MRRSAHVPAVLLAALVALLGLRAAPVAAQAPPALTSPVPAAGALVGAGTVEIAVATAGPDAIAHAMLRVDGVAVEHAVQGDRAGRLRAALPLAPGSHVAEALVTDDAGRTARRSWRFEVSGVAVRRLAGPDRLATAVALSAEQYPAAGSAASVVLARADDFADALGGAPLALRLDGPLLLTPFDRLPAAVGEELRRVLAPGGTVVVLGGTAVVGEEVAAAARRILDDGGPPPVLDPAPGTALAGLGAGTAFRIAGDLAVDAAGSQAQLEVDGAEVPLALRAEGTVLVAEVTTAPAAPDPADPGRPRHVRLVAAVRAAGGGVEPVRHVEGTYTAPAAAPVLMTAEGFARVGGDGDVAGAGGPLVTYSLEVEPATGVDPGAFAREAEAVLSHPRGWSGRGERRLQRVGEATPAIRVVLATPATVDRFCARAGLDTAGRYSCWNGAFAMINLERWTSGSPAFAAPLAEYRGYVLNHETGHGLGLGHVGCPAAGALAPVMVQQTISTGGCLPNGWPYP